MEDEAALMALRYRDLNPNQRKTLRAVVREGRKLPKHLQAVLMAAAVQTVLVEKNAEHTPGGDRDSGGAFQQRPSQGWGPAGETVSRDARQFYDVAKKMYRPGMSAGDLAAAVQRPAAQYRGRYAQRAQDADMLLQTTPLGGVGDTFDDRGELDAPHMQGTRKLVPDRAGRYDAVKALFDGGGVLDFALRIKEVQAGEAPRQRLEREGRHPSSLRAKNPVAQGRANVLELFWQGPGGVNVKNGKRVPQGFVSGHDHHVHVAAPTERGVLRLAKIAEEMGLTVGEHPRYGGVGGGHVKGSNHYARRAIDVTGDPRKLKAFAHRIAAMAGAA